MKTAKVLTAFVIMAFIAGISIAGWTGARDQQSKRTTVEKRLLCQLTPRQHPSLEAALSGFSERVTESDAFQIQFQTYRGTGGTEDLTDLVTQTLRDECQLVFVVSTPAAVLARRMIASEEIPVVYTAVTDPEGAGVVSSMAGDSLPITGVSDRFPVSLQVDLFTTIAPQAKTAGILYNPSEQNSQVLVKRTTRHLERKGVTVNDYPTNQEEAIPETTEQAAAESDMLIVNGDNMYTDALEIVISVAEEKDMPLFVGDPQSVSRGAVATASPNYEELGRRSGELALRILQGASAGDIPSEDPESFNYYINPRAAGRMNQSIPASVWQLADEWQSSPVAQARDEGKAAGSK